MATKEEILAATAIPEGESEIAGIKVRIRGLTSGEEIEHLAEGIQNGVLGVCSCCILNEDGKPLFSLPELKRLKAGTLKSVYADILALSYPKKEEVEKNS